MQGGLETVYQLVERNIGIIEDKLNAVALFGAIGGSWSFNLANESSDIDFCLVVDWKNQKGEMIQKEIIENELIEFFCVSLPDILDAWEEYHNHIHKYPTRFYRSNEEMEKIIKQEDSERTGFLQEILIKIFLSEKVIEFQKGILEENRENIRKNLRLIDVWDYEFNRAYGNYYEKICNKEKVPVRKYLYTIHQMVTCYALMRNEKLVMDFERIFASDSNYDAWFRDICLDLFKKNKVYGIDKADNCVQAEMRLNNWIEKGLEEILEEMKQKEEFMRNHYMDI
ncbi:MAG: hypothetical protein HFI03_00740 [Lachnospiraceae bacterium]|jgi:predicted nucleotidyltransferase|nr:hypothetical protein [Lachnospiraceae bacterium]